MNIKKIWAWTENLWDLILGLMGIFVGAGALVGLVIFLVQTIKKNRLPELNNEKLGELVLEDLFGTTEISQDLLYDFYDCDPLWSFNQTRSRHNRLKQIHHVLNARLQSFDTWKLEYKFPDGKEEQYKQSLQSAVNVVEDGYDNGDLLVLDRTLGNVGLWRKLLETGDSNVTTLQNAHELVFHDNEGKAFYINPNMPYDDVFDAWYKYLYPEEIDGTEYDTSDYTFDELIDNLDALDRTLKDINTDDIIQGVNNLWNGNKGNQIVNELKSKWNVDGGQLQTLLYFYLGRKRSDLFEKIDDDWIWLKGTYRKNNPILINNRNRSFKETSKLNVPSLNNNLKAEFDKAFMKEKENTKLQGNSDGKS